MNGRTYAEWLIVLQHGKNTVRLKENAAKGPAATTPTHMTTAIAEPQLEGIASAKARGIYRGRKPSIDPTKVKKMKADGMGPSAIAKALKIGRASVYRALES
jgi:hypothetical protein